MTVRVFFVRDKGAQFLVASALALVFDVVSAPAQSVEADIAEENIVESVLTNSDDVPETVAPVDLNEASTDDLFLIDGMTGRCVASIMALRNSRGRIRDFDGLSNLDGMTPEIMSRLKKRTYIAERAGIRAEAATYSSLSIQRASLYDSAFGEPGVINFQSISVAYRNIYGHFLTEKDAGERSYLDFCSFALTARQAGPFSLVSIGDYTIGLGSGLLFKGGGLISKSAGPISPLFAGRAYSLKPYRSKGESKFLRGAAVSVPVGAFEFTSFASFKSLTVRADSSGSVTSIDYTGLNLPSSVPRSRLRENLAGGIVRFEVPGAAGGVSAAYFSYDRPFVGYYSKEALAFEAFTRVRLENTAIAAEILLDKRVSFTGNACVDYGEARFAVGVRALRSRLVQNYSGPLSENFPTSQEQGIYFGSFFRPASFVKIGVYYDRFNIGAVSGEPDRNGEEIFVDSYVSLSRPADLDGSATVLYLRYRYKTKEDSYVPSADFPAALSVIAGSKQDFRVEVKHGFSPAFSTRARFERNLVSSGERGEMVLVDAGWRTKAGAVDVRFSFYRTDSYRSAMYTVDKELPHVAKFNLFYGDGARISILTTWKLSGSLTAGLKASRDIYHDTRQIAAGAYTKYVAGLSELSMEINYAISLNE